MPAESKLNISTESSSANSEVDAGKLAGSRFISAGLKEFWVQDLMNPIENFCIRAKFTPNQITIAGLILSFVASFLFATHHLILGGWMIILSGCCDFLDGRIARRLQLKTQSGAFFDSVMDRYMDTAVLCGLAYLFRDSWVLLLVFLAIIGTVATPYIRAKSESLGLDGAGGEMQRPERIVYIGIGAMLSGYLGCLMYPFLSPGEEIPPYFLIIGLSVVAFMSNKVALDRFFKTFNALKATDNRK
ncbi:MAG: CDP-alcohol phosphatidyltransferase family protein [Deltaproteobacteria bacterium]|nr:CDP-alcohol phosphatidyltransferase family protein [Deltaproteobacteria bacterium]